MKLSEIRKRFSVWMNTPPDENDLFFTHIRETYQALKLYSGSK